MQAIDQTRNTYCSRALIAAIFISLVFIVVGYKSIGKGLVLGTLFSILNFVLISMAIPRQVGHSNQKSFIIALSSLLFRFVLMAVPLIIAVKWDQVDLIGVILGLLMIQVVILCEHLIKYLSSDRRTRI
jgi:Ca2+/Na+ antiporter